ncbi:MAG: transcription-repair coupling factor, partial [Lachnospiraceae bacterium]|nr:transcription-repair coupling factor [Lachnospiraceae bacterium]
MRSFTGPLEASPEWQGIRDDIAGGVFPLALDGCADTQKCHQVFSLSGGFRKKLIITYSEAKASEFLEDYRFFDGNILKYPSKDVIFFSADVHGNLLVKERARVIRKLLDGQPVTVIAKADALLDRILPADRIRQSLITLEPGMEMDPEELAARLTDMGFTRNYQAEMPGEFAVRGGIIDIYNLSDESPCRIEFFDTEVDSVRSFDSVSQRSIENLKSFTVYPASEYVFSREERDDAVKAIKKDLEKRLRLLENKELHDKRNRLASGVSEFIEGVSEAYDGTNIDSYISYFTGDTVTLLDYFSDDDSIIWIDEANRTEEAVKAVADEFAESMGNRLEGGYILPGQADIIYPFRYIFQKLADMNTVIMSGIYKRAGSIKEKSLRHITVRSVDSFADNFPLLKKDLFEKQKRGYRVIVAAGSATKAERFSSELIDMGL